MAALMEPASSEPLLKAPPPRADHLGANLVSGRLEIAQLGAKKKKKKEFFLWFVLK